jgi:DNA (cytosine-5)-methyltransferase 1
MKLRALDGYCCAGGAGDGIVQAGFDVTGVDIEDQPEYPHAFYRSSVLDLNPAYLRRTYDFIWASPPCQAFTAYKRRTDHVARP